MKPKVNLIAMASFSAFCVLFMIIYYQFSHDITSLYMSFMWAIPLVLGVIPYSIMTYRKIALKSVLAAPIYNSGIITLTIGACFKGVLEIFGTTKALSIVYPIVGIPLLLVGVALMIKYKTEKISE